MLFRLMRDPLFWLFLAASAANGAMLGVVLS